jgi:hypothetical protein
MATVTVDQQRLVLNAFAAIFQNNLVSKDLVTWRKFNDEMNDRNGLTVTEQVTPDYTTTFTPSGVADLSGGVQDTTFGSETYRLDQTIGSSMGWGDFVKIRDIGAARESQALRKAALRLAIDIDAYILNFAANVSNNWLGDGTSAVAEWDDIVSGYTRLKEEGVDDDGNLRAVLTYGDKQALGADILADNASMTDLGEGVYRNGWDGKVGGIPTLFTQQLPSFQTGSRTAGATNYPTGSPANTYESVCISATPGNFLTGLLAIDGVGTTGTVREGETFTIEGLYAYDNRAKKTLNHLQEFRVVGTGDAVGAPSDGINNGLYTATTGAIAALRYYPAIITTGPYRNVTNTNGGGATWDNLVVTFKGAASSTLQPRFLANKDAIVVNTADLIMPATGIGSRKALTKVPLSVRMWQDSVFATGEHRVRFDVAIKANVAPDGRRRTVRINGS